MNPNHSLRLNRSHALRSHALRSLGVALLVAISCSFEPFCAVGANPPATLSARDIAAQLSDIRQDGSSYVRLRMEITKLAPALPTVLQLQIKARRTKTASDMVVQVLWPKDRKGEAVLLHKTAGGLPSGSVLLPPGTLKSLNASQAREPLFGSDLSYEDFCDNFFSWRNQNLVGTEGINGESCLIIESKPGKGDQSSYASVRSWVDPIRLVPLRVERYLDGGRLACRVETTRIAKDEKGRAIPASLSVRREGKGSVTVLEGSRSSHGVTYTEGEFTPEGLKDLSQPHASAE